MERESLLTAVQPMVVPEVRADSARRMAALSKKPPPGALLVSL
jgi:hypothetical protein